jgi:hypothetical protein
MNAQSFETLPATNTVSVMLDGEPIRIPSERRSINAIRAYLEAVALANQRAIFSFSVNGQPANVANAVGQNCSTVVVSAESVDLTEIPLRLIDTALRQTTKVKQEVTSAISIVLINGGAPAQELWWEITHKLREPLLTITLLPESFFGPPSGAASPLQLRRWQLQQLATIIGDVDVAASSQDAVLLSTALEHRVLPWLEALHRSLALMYETALAGVRCARY